MMSKQLTLLCEAKASQTQTSPIEVAATSDSSPSTPPPPPPPPPNHQQEGNLIMATTK
ncbi:hypothetical protein YC2023_043220 [Brassica napus]